ncbi:tetratricopeptide repeat protein [Sulfurimonas sp. SAG-AH-194-C20]|nr:tetratricopeptide repeat protein [Sulfurimonas sp. SAG-AH-194-C20]MDF1878037.1 tetratricopeptide repeat protein [Sulfurimonas sp. SAG-AH-194-C20]
MNSFFIEFRDPLFSIIVFFSIIFAITFFSYWWSKYRRNEDSKYLDKFLKQFSTLPSKDELKVLISSGDLSEKSWLLLAHSYYKSGNYEKCIEIYNEILNLGASKNRQETMFLLGRTYLKAGFLERAKQIFLSILKTNPRTPEALKSLLLVYEQMRDYKSALDVLEPLDELNEDIFLESTYLKVMEILNNNKITQEEKSKKLLDIYINSHQLTYMLFEYLFLHNPSLAWEHFDHSKSELLSDILWKIEPKDLNLDIISQNGYLRELYSARGDVELAKSSSVFELDVLIKLEGKAKATLSFEYMCDDCKTVQPFVFHRCPSCHSIGSLYVECHLSKDFYKDIGEENNSFQ